MEEKEVKLEEVKEEAPTPVEVVSKEDYDAVVEAYEVVVEAYNILVGEMAKNFAEKYTAELSEKVIEAARANVEARHAQVPAEEPVVEDTKEPEVEIVE